jgi:NAD(P)H dehydrogenase (quinone)
MILLTGASGHIGRRAAELLAASGQALRLMVRASERAPKMPLAENVRGDYGRLESLDAPFRGIATALVISVSGEPGKRAVLHRSAFEAAARAGVGHVVYLSLQSSSPHSKYPWSRDHFVSEQSLAATGLPHTVLRNAFYMDMFLHQFDNDGVIHGPGARVAALSFPAKTWRELLRLY